MRRPSLQRPRQLQINWKLSGLPCSPSTGEYSDLEMLSLICGSLLADGNSHILHFLAVKVPC